MTTAKTLAVYATLAAAGVALVAFALQTFATSLGL